MADRKQREHASRVNSRNKRLAYSAIWARLVRDYGREGLARIGLPSEDALWERHVSRRFRNFNGDAFSSEIMENTLRAMINSRIAVAAPPRVPEPNSPPRIIVRMLPIPGERIMLPPIEDAIRTIIGRLETPEQIEHRFETMGFGQSGRQCPVCLEPRSKWTRFSWECNHEMCVDCAAEWLKQNKRPGGTGCPGCIAEHANPPKQVDPTAVFGYDKVGQDYQSMLFASMQIPVLQEQLNAYCNVHTTQSSSSPSPIVINSRCPKCLSVHSGPYTLVRCPNPKCAMEYCSKCESTLCYDSNESMNILRRKHLAGECSASIAETSELRSGPGLIECSKCNTPLWHAKNHGCHHVKCPKCGHEQCHCCGRPYHDPACKCPIFCRPDVKCNCDPSCPECKHHRCALCSGNCDTCNKRIESLNSS